MDGCRAQGFTLLELLVALAVTGVLATLVIPAMSALVQDSRLGARSSLLFAHLHRARSEAISRKTPVTLCTGDARGCAKRSDWHLGWIVFLDPDEDRHRDTGEELLAVQAPFRDGTAVRFRAFGSSRNLTYYPSGYTRDRNGTFTFCDQRGAAAARALVLYRTGRLRTSRRAADGGPLSCD